MKVKHLLKKLSINQSDFYSAEIRRGLAGKPLSVLRSFDLKDDDYKGTDDLTINYFCVSDRTLTIYVK